MSLLQAIQPMLPSSERKVVKNTSSSGSFVAIGTAYLLLSDSLQVFDAYSEGPRLAQTVQQLFATVMQSKTAGSTMRLVQDHSQLKYTSKVQAAVCHTVPILFMGGLQEDYEAVSIKRMSPASGMTACEQCVLHHSFCEQHAVILVHHCNRS